MEAKIDLTEVNDELGIRLYVDLNGLFYFSKHMGNLIASPFGNIMGFKKIQVFEKVIVCYMNYNMFYLFLRENEGWLSYIPWEGSKVFDFYYEPEITSDFIILSIQGTQHKENACFVFETGCLLHKPGDLTKIGLFDEIPIVTNWKEEKVLILSRAKQKSAFWIKSNKFVGIKLPVELDNNKDLQFKFFFICEKYAVLKLGNDFNPNFFVYSFIDNEYINIYRSRNSELSEKYWKPKSIVCNDNFLALSYISADKKEEPEWLVKDTSEWQNILENFERKIETSVFTNVSLGKSGQLIITKEFEASVEKFLG